jgi:hypothetical protein
MKIQKAIKILKNHNKWRKGSEEVTMAEPKELSKAIDLVIQFAKNYQALKLYENAVSSSLHYNIAELDNMIENAEFVLKYDAGILKEDWMKTVVNLVKDIKLLRNDC